MSFIRYYDYFASVEFTFALIVSRIFDSTAVHIYPAANLRETQAHARPCAEF